MRSYKNFMLMTH